MKSAAPSSRAAPTRNFWTMLAESTKREEKLKTAQVFAMPKSRYAYNETTARRYAAQNNVKLSPECSDLAQRVIYIKIEGKNGSVTIERPMDARGSCWSVYGDLVTTVRNHLNKGPAIVIAVEIVSGIGRFKA
jgi:hypothetical protein